MEVYKIVFDTSYHIEKYDTEKMRVLNTSPLPYNNSIIYNDSIGFNNELYLTEQDALRDLKNKTNYNSYYFDGKELKKRF